MLGPGARLGHSQHASRAGLLLTHLVFGPELRQITFERLTAEHDAFVGESLAGMAERLGLMNRQLAGLRDDLTGGG